MSLRFLTLRLIRTLDHTSGWQSVPILYSPRKRALFGLAEWQRLLLLTQERAASSPLVRESLFVSCFSSFLFLLAIQMQSVNVTYSRRSCAFTMTAARVRSQ
jgi:hypothetical protein